MFTAAAQQAGSVLLGPCCLLTATGLVLGCLQVLAMAYDNPIPGYNTPTTSNLRLWDALPLDEFDLQAFNAGDYDKVCSKHDARGDRSRGLGITTQSTGRSA
jgi:hypothetical protein